MILCAVGMTCAQSIGLYQPMGRTAYTTSSFGESRGTRYHGGIDFATQMEEGWPVTAPVDGTVESLSLSPFGYGKHIRFLGSDGRLWLFAHLSGFAPRLDSVADSRRRDIRKNALTMEPRMAFRKGDTLGFSGSTGIGNPHLHVETRSKDGSVYYNPCATGLVCTDTIAPAISGLAIWSKRSIRISAQQALDSGCASYPEAMNGMSSLDFAIRLVDYSHAPFENPMSVYRLSAYQNGKAIYQKRYDSIKAATTLPIRDELLWSEEADTAGDWHHFRAKVDPRTPLQFEVEDFAGHTTSKTVRFQANCPTDSLPKPWKNQDSLLFTFLSRPWISLKSCQYGRWEIWEEDSTGTRVSRRSKDLCKENNLVAPHNMLPLSSLVLRWPVGNALVFIADKDTLRHISYRYLAKESEAVDHRNGITQKWSGIGKTSWNLVTAWQRRASDSTQPARWEFHPKGMQLYGGWEMCADSITAPMPLYWLGETSQKWNLFGKQELREGKRCFAIDELRDVASLVDIMPPTTGTPYIGKAMVNGRYTPSLRIPLHDDLSGASFGCLAASSPEKPWIPLDYDSEPGEIEIVYADLPGAGKSITLDLCDEAGNRARSTITVPPLPNPLP